jgi:5-hydroxyisourate hydrolase
MSTISTHVLDVARGKPANAVRVSLEVQNADESWNRLAEAWTDDDGRVKPFFLVETYLDAGVYRLTFDTEDYFSRIAVEAFYPEIAVVFKIVDATQHYHVPVLLSPYGYSTYRGS